MASPEALLGGVAGLVLLVLLLPLIIFLVALWRIGTGALGTARALHAIEEQLNGEDGTASVTESLKLQAEAIAGAAAAYANRGLPRSDVADRGTTPRKS